MIRLSSLVFWLFVAGASLQASTRAELVSLHEKVPAGTVLQVALLVTPTEKSHVYYLAPGEMGFPVSIQWKNLPEGVLAGPLQFPLPHRVKTGKLATIGYEEPTYFFSSLTLRKDIPPGKLKLQAEASWLACSDETCVPGEQTVSVSIEILAPGSTSSPASLTLAKELRKIPVNAPKSWTATVSSSKEHWLFHLKPPSDWPAPSEPSNIEAFSETPEALHSGAKPKIQIKSGSIEVMALKSEYADPEVTPNLILFGLNPPLRFQPEKL